MTADGESLGPSRRFDFGVDKVYAIFAYHDMSSEQLCATGWIQNGETTKDTRDVDWDEGPADGVTWLSFDATEDLVIASGDYTIDLLLGGELFRSPRDSEVASSGI